MQVKMLTFTVFCIVELYTSISELNPTVITEESQTTVSEHISETVLQVETSIPIIETDIVSTTQTSVANETVYRPSVLDFVEDTLVIPEGKTTISWNEYSDRDDITSIIIPESVTQICGNSFQDCDNLESVIIPDGVTSIGEGAFRYCDNLKEVVISKSVESIDTDAFGDCYNLNYVTFLNEDTKLQPRAFARTPWGSIKYWTEFEKADSGYILTECKSAYGNIIIPDGVTEISDNAFTGENVYSVTIPSSVTKIGSEAFKSCNDLEEVIIEGEYEIITFGTDVFANCNNLKSIICNGKAVDLNDIIF